MKHDLSTEEGRKQYHRDVMETITLSSGRELDTLGCIGITEDLEVQFGADDGMGYGDPPFTAAERIELGNKMIALWTRFRDSSGEECLTWTKP